MTTSNCERTSPTDGKLCPKILDSRRVRTNLVLALLLCGCGFLAGNPAQSYAKEANASKIEPCLQQLYQAISPAVVLIFPDEERKRPVASGVVVSPDGFIALTENQQLARLGSERKPIYVQFPDQRCARGTMLGWSTSWKIALAKIDSGNDWPHVKFAGDNEKIHSGDYCALLEYSLKTPYEFENMPSLQLGLITSSADDRFTTSLKDGRWSPVFNLDGQLLGITSYKPVSAHDSCTSHHIFRQLWQQMSEGKNVDLHMLSEIPMAPDTSESDISSKRSPHSEQREFPVEIEEAAKATVRIRPVGWAKRGWSGVIVDPAGYITTCAHHRIPAGTKITVELSDGRNLSGILLSSNQIIDIGLAKITEQTSFPYVPMGSTFSLKNNEPCWILGYPTTRSERSPLIRRSSVSIREDIPWSSTLYTSKDADMYGGDSGGGVFDSQGRLIGVHEGKNPNDYGRHQRVELLKQYWDALMDANPSDSTSSPLSSKLGSSFSEETATDIVVTILRDNEASALGIVVNREGQILTKASEVFGKVSVQFADGRELPAVMQKLSRTHDLALLNVAKTCESSATFSSQPPAPVGTIVGAPVPGVPLRVGVLSHSTRSIPTMRGNGLASVQETNAGVTIDGTWFNAFDLPLQSGDVITHIAGHPTPDLESYLKLVGDGNTPGMLITNAGDPIWVTVLRAGTTLKYCMPQPPPEWSEINESRRHAGFPCVFDTDITLERQLCGGPLLNRSGEVIGVTIATRRDWGGQTHVLPAEVVLNFLAD